MPNENQKSLKYNDIQNYYSHKLWTTKMVKDAVGRWLTEAEAREILNDPDSPWDVPTPSPVNGTVYDEMANAYNKGVQEA